MIQEKLQLVHFGNDCASGILINDILNIKKKQLFQLGFYNFNNILEYLKENKYEEIYDKKYLFFNNIKIKKFSNSLKKYKNLSVNESIIHKKYNFEFNHDYEIKNNEIINYDFIVNVFDEKIKNFKNCLESKNKILFITFTNHDLKILKMINLLKKKTNNWFKLVIFTGNKNLNYSTDQIELIHLNNEYHRSWFLKPMKDRFILYEEIYNKFYNALINYIDLPVFEKTNYYINYKNDISSKNFY